MSKKKVLIAYATAGIGHKKASFAVKDALEEKYPDVTVRMIDVLDYTNPLFKKAYPEIYLFLIEKLIFLWGFLYYLSDNRAVHFLTFPLRKAYHILNSIRLVRFLNEFKPDVVVSTHFLLPDVCSYVKKKYKLKMHVINVVTDYRAHSFWISDGVDTYAVAHEETKRDLTDKWGILPGQVKVTGIPVEQKFSKPHEKRSYRDKLGIPQDKFCVLLLSGGYGVGPMFEMVGSLNILGPSLSVIVVCGHNKSLHKKIEDLKKNADMHILNLGYVHNVDELMAASDVYIGKAGGISTTEALVMGLPLIYIRPIPGQEQRNVDFITKRNAGICLKSTRDILLAVGEMKDSSQRMTKIKEAIKGICKVNAATDIADLAIGTQ